MKITRILYGLYPDPCINEALQHDVWTFDAADYSLIAPIRRAEKLRELVISPHEDYIAIKDHDGPSRSACRLYSIGCQRDQEYRNTEDIIKLNDQGEPLHSD